MIPLDPIRRLGLALIHTQTHCYFLLSEYNISAAAIAIFSLAFMTLGSLCLLGAFGKGRDYLLRPAGMFFAFAGKHNVKLSLYFFECINGLYDF